MLYFPPPEPAKVATISVQDLLGRIDQVAAFSHYMHQDVRPGKKYRNPTREDKHPDCYFSWSSRLRLIDPARNRSYDIIDLVSELLSLPTQEAIQHIWQSQVGGYLKPTQLSKKLFRTPEGEQRLWITTRPFDEVDRQFWGQYLLTEEDLYNNDSYAVSEYRWECTTRKPITLCYGYYYRTQDRAKLYMPGSDIRFLSDIPITILDGLRDLDYTKPAILTKSRKDRMVVSKAGLLNVIDVQAENTHCINEQNRTLLSKFPYVIVPWDNDEAGRRATQAVCENEGYVPVVWPKGTNAKITDTADLVKQTQSFQSIHDLLGPYL